MNKDRFDLEQEILDCWKLIDDIELLSNRSSDSESFRALAKVYEHKFNQLWDTFEFLIENRKIV
jgi:hypothetical protein